MIFAEDASKCRAIVEGQTSKGETATGKQVQDVSTYNQEQHSREAEKVKSLELLWKFVVSSYLLYLFFFLRRKFP